MNGKIKLFSIYLEFILTFCFMICGIFAAPLVNLNIGGIVNYELPPDLEITSVSLSGATQGAHSELNGGLPISNSLDLSNLEFASGETTVTISMTSLNENYIKNIVSWNQTSNVTINSTSLFLPINISEKLENGENRSLKIIVKNNNSSAVKISGLKVSFKTYSSLLQNSGREWFVEMGTISTATGSRYLRWKYFADASSVDSNGYDVPVRVDGSSRPSGIGYFILDDYTDILEMTYNNEYSGNYHQNNGWDNVNANDYATSTVRAYINGKDVSKEYKEDGSAYIPYGTPSNMFSDLNIDIDNDIIYQNIIARTLGDLYSGMSTSATNPTEVKFPDLSQANSGYQYTKDDQDKFWLISYYEGYYLLDDYTERLYDSYYWTRTPTSSCHYHAFGFNGAVGAILGYGVNSPSAARAAFKLAI